MHILDLMCYMPSEFLCDMPYADALFLGICNMPTAYMPKKATLRSNLVLKEIIGLWRENHVSNPAPGVTCMLDAAAFTTWNIEICCGSLLNLLIFHVGTALNVGPSQHRPITRHIAQPGFKTSDTPV
jgi:hypothetical protein